MGNDARKKERHQKKNFVKKYLVINILIAKKFTFSDKLKYKYSSFFYNLNGNISSVNLNSS